MKRHPRLVSVIIPAYHRPDALQRAVRSVLAQQLPEATALEVIIAVSDPSAGADVETARALTSDPRVRMTLSEGGGSASSRNAALKIAAGDVIAFTDDDCEAQPGWLVAGLEALRRADLVQGSTRPAGPIPNFGHSVTVDPPTWRWETCNLLARRELFDRFGVFDDKWDALDRHPFGEDIEWGWRVVRGGARPAFAPSALVLHAVTGGDLRRYLQYWALLGRYPELLRRTPEVRRAFWLGLFFNRRHALITTCLGLGLASIVLRMRGRKSLSGAAVAVGASMYLWPIRQSVKAMIIGTGLRTITDVTELASLVYGSVRWKRPLL
ncbi:MAG: glycosyltransferase family A protein [Candidatus Dormiibacterota bacterium]